MKEEKLVIAVAEDKLAQCKNNYMITNTGFLDLRQQSLCRPVGKADKEVKTFFYGGFSEAERRIFLCIPDYIAADEEDQLHEYFMGNQEENPLTLLEVEHNGYRELSHRDYLGALTGMGIKREALGDILVYPEGADIVVMKEMVDFILSNFSKAGRVGLELREKSLADINCSLGRTEEKSETVASLRLDNVMAAAFRISRSSATEAIKGGIVFVNGQQMEKPEKQVKEGDKLVLRGKGKAILKEIGGTTRKDRIYITFTNWGV